MIRPLGKVGFQSPDLMLIEKGFLRIRPRVTHVSQSLVRSGIYAGERCASEVLGRILERPGPPLVPRSIKSGRITRRVRRANAGGGVHAVRPLRWSAGRAAAVGGPRDGGACRVAPSDTSSPPPQPPVLCCLAASDVWVCREVPEWALEIGHSLPVLPALTHM